MPTGAQARQYREATCDLAGNITAIADLGGGARGRNYVYDALHRLTQGQLLLPGGGAVGGQMDYAYDAVGNRTRFDVADPRLSGVETLTLDAFSNQLVSSAWDFGWTRALTHTDSGNRASDVADLVGNLSMEYDSSDRLVEVRSGNKAAGEYLHNALGQRVAKTANRATTHYLYDLGGNIVAEADLPRRGASSITAEYVWLNGRPLAYIVTANVYYVHTDHLGTPQVLTDGAASLAWNADYAPFGYAEITGSLTFNLRFPGQYYDAETQAHYNGFRTYDPSLGRYLESDPIGLRGGWNTYAYVGGNPVTRADPEGLNASEVSILYARAKEKHTGATFNFPGTPTAVSITSYLMKGRVGFTSWTPEAEIFLQKEKYYDMRLADDPSCPALLEDLLATIIHEGQHAAKTQAEDFAAQNKIPNYEDTLEAVALPLAAADYDWLDKTFCKKSGCGAGGGGGEGY